MLWKGTLPWRQFPDSLELCYYSFFHLTYQGFIPVLIQWFQGYLQTPYCPRTQVILKTTSISSPFHVIIDIYFKWWRNHTPNSSKWIPQECLILRKTQHWHGNKKRKSNHGTHSCKSFLIIKNHLRPNPQPSQSNVIVSWDMCLLSPKVLSPVLHWIFLSSGNSGPLSKEHYSENNRMYSDLIP